MFRALFIKDIRSLWRNPQLMIGSCAFALALVVLVSFAFRRTGYGPQDIEPFVPGVLWVVLLFCVAVALNQSFRGEWEGRALSGLMLTPVDLGLVYISKCCAHLLFVLPLLLLIVVFVEVFLGVQTFSQHPQLLGVMCLGAIGAIGLGTLLSAMSSVSKSREVVLAMLFYPLCIPLLVACGSATAQLLDTGSLALSDLSLVFICVFDVISLTLSWILFEHVLQS